MTRPLIDITPEEWRIVRDILHKHVPDREVWAFGSRVRGTVKPYSDLDLVIITDAPLSLELTGAVAEDFSESDLPFRVDIVDWARIEQAFRSIIENAKVVVQPAQTAPQDTDGHGKAGVRPSWH